MEFDDAFPLDEPLTRSEQEILLAIAREAIAAHLAGGAEEIDGAALPPRLRRPAGAFVTLTIDGGLRGCIGSVVPVEPLFRTVSRNAVNAGFGDPRFPHLRPEEAARIEIEISVLGRIERIGGPEDVVVGRDGLIVRAGRSAGLLLPQVADEYGWTAEQFLSRTCEKAGLPPGSWREKWCSLERFSAQVFN
jgi:AmmeMemoRadiSam system protein A